MQSMDRLGMRAEVDAEATEAGTETVLHADRMQSMYNWLLS